MNLPKRVIRNSDSSNCSTASVLCDNCMGEGERWDKESIDQWYSCEKCNGFGRVWKIMIRIVDMREATSCDGSFSVWDTVKSRFVEVLGEQSWDGESDFRECVRMAGNEDFDVERIVSLLPEWAKR